MVENLVPIVCSVLLTALVAALIFNSKFRQDIMAGEGEASVLGILSVKGVVIVLLSGLFLGALILTAKSGMNTNNTNTTGFIVDDVLPLIEQKHSSDISYIDQTTERLKSDVEDFMNDKWNPRFLSLAVNNHLVVEDLKNATSIEEKQRILSDFSKDALYQIFKQKQELIDSIDRGYRLKISALRTHYRKILIAAASQDLETYREMISKVPHERIMVEQVEAKISEFLKDQSKGQIDISAFIRYKTLLKELEGEKRDN